MQFENTIRPMAGKPVSRQSPQQAIQRPATVKANAPVQKAPTSTSTVNRAGTSSNPVPSQPRFTNTLNRPAIRSIQRPAQPAATRQPASLQNGTTVNNAAGRTIKPRLTPTVKGWPSYAVSGVPKASRQLRRGAFNPQGTGATTITGAAKKLVTGWPHLKQIAGQMLPKIPASVTQKLRPGSPYWGRYWRAGRVMKPGVAGTPLYPATSSKPVQNRSVNYRRPGVPGNPPSRYYYGTNYRRPSVYVNNVAPGGDDGQVTGWTSQQPAAGTPAHSCNCGSNVAPGLNTQPGIPLVQPSGTCQNCGENSLGCATVSRFSFNSTKLKPHHKIQLKALASKILAGVKAVVAIGHTDTSGPEKYNDDLGYRRALTVVNELRRELNQLQPHSDRPVFWRIDSAGESQPLPGANAANSRRVEICLKQAGT